MCVDDSALNVRDGEGMFDAMRDAASTKSRIGDRFEPNRAWVARQ